jgi:hypothetical protein
MGFNGEDAIASTAQRRSKGKGKKKLPLKMMTSCHGIRRHWSWPTEQQPLSVIIENWKGVSTGDVIGYPMCMRRQKM